MEIGHKIQQAFVHQPKVYVEGLGVFSQIHQSATYDERRNVYLPPIDYIEFEADATGDYSLADYLQRQEGRSPSDAKDWVDAQVEAIRAKLSENSEFFVAQLGTFVRFGDSIIFKAMDLTSFSFGPVKRESVASSLELAEPEVQEEPHLPVVEETVEKEEAEDERVIVEDTVTTVAAEDNHSEPTEEVIPAEPIEEIEEKKSAATLWYVVAAVVALGIVGALWYAQRGGQPTTNSLAQHTADSVASAAPQEEVSVVETPVDSIATDTTATLEPTETTEAVVGIPEGHNYYIIIGSRIATTTAEEMVADYHQKGFDRVRLLPTRNGMATVIWDSYTTKLEGDSAVQYVVKNHVKDAWITTVKK